MTYSPRSNSLCENRNEDFYKATSSNFLFVDQTKKTEQHTKW